MDPTGKLSKGKGVLDCVLWVRRRRELSQQAWVKQLGEVKEIWGDNLARKFPSQQGGGQVGTTTKEWVMGHP